MPRRDVPRVPRPMGSPQRDRQLLLRLQVRFGEAERRPNVAQLSITKARRFRQVQDLA